MAWAATRVGAIVFVALFTVALFFDLFRRFFMFLLFNNYDGKSQFLFALQFIFGPAVAGIIIGAYAHFIPCIWLACDGSDDDDMKMRGLVWLITGLVVATVGWIVRTFEACTRSNWSTTVFQIT